jgi:predicted nuclease of restriction endonuclease-like (RecB) superfamily
MTDPAKMDEKLSETLREIDPTRLNPDREFGPLLEIIESAQARAYRAVNRELVGMYWDIGAYISAKAHAEGWGTGVVAEFSRWVRGRLPGIKGFSPQNVWRMKQLFETYQGNPKLAELLGETTWTNNLLIMAGAKTDEAREFYLLLATKYRYGSQELERQIDALLFERTMLSNQTTKQIVARHPELASLRDSYTLEFLGLPEQHRERDLRAGIVAHLKDFILEFGPDFAFLGQEYRIQVGGTDFFIDLLFQNRELACLVAVELKVGKFRPEQVGQLDFYLEALDRDVRKPHENPSIGLLLCTSKDDTVVEYALSRSLSPAMVAEYQLRLPDKKVLKAKLRELSNVAELEAAENQDDQDSTQR